MMMRICHNQLTLAALMRTEARAAELTALMDMLYIRAVQHGHHQLCVAPLWLLSP